MGFFFIPACGDNRTAPAKRRWEGIMPLQESHPRGKVAAVAAPQADLAGDRNKTGPTVR